MHVAFNRSIVRALTNKKMDRTNHFTLTADMDHWMLKQKGNSLQHLVTNVGYFFMLCIGLKGEVHRLQPLHH